MKTIVSFHDSIKAMIENHFDYDGVIRAIQGAMNDPQTVTVKEGKTVRGGVKGGQSYKKDGSLSIKDMTWSERLNLDYSAKYTAPIETMKWHDSLVNHFNKSGLPAGELTVAIVPRHVLQWLEKFPVKTDKDKESAKAKEIADGKAAIAETQALVDAGQIEPGKGKGKGRANVPA